MFDNKLQQFCNVIYQLIRNRLDNKTVVKMLQGQIFINFVKSQAFGFPKLDNPVMAVSTCIINISKFDTIRSVLDTTKCDAKKNQLDSQLVE